MRKLILLSWILPAAAFAQDDSGWKLFSAGAQFSVNQYWGNFNNPDISDLVKVPSEVSQSSSYYYGYFYPNAPFRYINSSTNYSLQLGITPNNEKRALNLGLNYSVYRHPTRSSTYNFTDSIIDTLTVNYASGGQQIILLDSMSYNQEVYSQTLQVASVSADYVFKTKKRILTAYAGGGLTFGVSTVSKIRRTTALLESFRYVDTNGYETMVPYSNYNYQAAYGAVYYPTDVVESEFKVLDAKTAIIIAPYIPMGVEITPFIERKWLSKIGIDVFAKIGAEMRMMNGAATSYRPFYSYGASLKYFI